jgi:hypothetical protein
MFWCFVGLEAFAHLASEFKHPDAISPRADDRPAAGRLGLLGLYRAGPALPRLWRGDGRGRVAAEYRGPPVRRQALWVACVIGYLACFASLNIYIQSFARLVWSQAQYKPESYLARLSPRQIPRNALNAVLGCCVVSTLGIYALDINLDALIVYANGIFIMIYLLCMLAGCRLLRGRYRLLAVVGSILCLLLLAMVGWKSLYALVMLAGCGCFYPGASWRQERIPARSQLTGPGMLIAAIVFMVQTVALFIFTLEFPFKGLSAASSGAKAAARHPAEAQMRHQLHRQVLLHRRQQQQQAEEVGKEPRQQQQQTGDNQRHAFDHLRRRALARGHLLLHQQEVFEALVTHQRHPDHRAKDHQDQRHKDAQHVRDLDKDRYLNVNVKKKAINGIQRTGVSFINGRCVQRRSHQFADRIPLRWGC